MKHLFLWIMLVIFVQSETIICILEDSTHHSCGKEMLFLKCHAHLEIVSNICIGDDDTYF